MFGNCISYTNAQRYINTIAIEADQQLERDGIFIPKSAKLGNFTRLAIDNVDFHENTKDGKTLHATTQNIDQHPSEPESSHSAISGIVCLVKTRASSSKRTQISEPLEEHLSAKERQRGLSVSGSNLISDRVEENSKIDDINLFWQFVRMAPTHFIPTPDHEISRPIWRSFDLTFSLKKNSGQQL